MVVEVYTDADGWTEHPLAEPPRNRALEFYRPDQPPGEKPYLRFVWWESTQSWQLDCQPDERNAHRRGQHWFELASSMHLHTWTMRVLPVSG